MEDHVKRMTVSFGAFSCTIEGFEDPFPIMQRIVEYFQKLSKDDPNFGLRAAFNAPTELTDIVREDANEDVTAAFNGSDLVISAADEADVEAASRGDALVEAEELWDDYAVLNDEVDVDAQDAVPASHGLVDQVAEGSKDADRVVEDAVAEALNGAKHKADVVDEASTGEAAPLDVTASLDDSYDEVPLAEFEQDQALTDLDDVDTGENSVAELMAEAAQDTPDDVRDDESDENVPAGLLTLDTPIVADGPVSSDAIRVSGTENLSAGDNAFKLGFGGEPGLDASGTERVKTTATLEEEFAAQGMETGVFNEDGIRFSFDEPQAEAEAGTSKDADVQAEASVEQHAVVAEPVPAMAGDAPQPAPLVLGAAMQVEEKKAPVLQLVDPIPGSQNTAASVPVPDGSTKSMRDFANAAGAATLPELLEASAAYVTLVSGRDSFSRNELLSAIDDVPESMEFTKESRIRTFSTMVQGGRIETEGDGKYTLSDEARAFYRTAVSK